jgi:hypothetical protein
VGCDFGWVRYREVKALGVLEKSWNFPTVFLPNRVDITLPISGGERWFDLTLAAIF